ncbi:MAG: hypothetical protein LBR15_06345 [Methanobrevibacter sp.]|jgi:hypothetical protein|nr:hypothetical protein [Candidatus Methanovirga australis]
MKRGRPTTHVKARWISFRTGYKELFYELDENGNLILDSNKKPVIHHERLIPSQIHQTISLVIDNPFGNTTIKETPMKNFPIPKIKEKDKELQMTSLFFILPFL